MEEVAGYSGNWPFKVGINTLWVDEVDSWCRQHVGLEYVKWKMTVDPRVIRALNGNNTVSFTWNCVYYFSKQTDAMQFAMTWG